MKTLEHELLRGFRALHENDRDLRSLIIWCNPNFIRGPDKEVKIKVLEILRRLKKENKIISKKKILHNKEYILYSLI